MGKTGLAGLSVIVLRSLLLAGSLVVIMSPVEAWNYDQQDISARKISIALKDVSLRAALTRISYVAHVSFVYVNSVALDKNKVSITARNEKVSVLLKKLLTPYSFAYRVVDDRIVIRYARPVEEAKIFIENQ